MRIPCTAAPPRSRPASPNPPCLPCLRADTHTLRIPEVHHYGVLAGAPGGQPAGSFIVMEYLDMKSGRLDQVTAAALRRRFAPGGGDGAPGLHG